MSRKEAVAQIRAHGGTVVDLHDDSANLVVLGADVLPVDMGEVLPAEAVERARAGRLEIISETQLWERWGLADESVTQRQLYTPAMLSELLKVPIATISVAVKWSFFPTLFMPNSMTPRKPASRKKAVSTS